MTDIERAKKLIWNSITDGLMRVVILDAIEAAVKEERDACKKIARDMATRELLYAPEEGGSHPFDAARRMYARQIAEEIGKRGQA